MLSPSCRQPNRPASTPQHQLQTWLVYKVKRPPHLLARKKVRTPTARVRLPALLLVNARKALASTQLKIKTKALRGH
jgi:hypothetical protein